MASSENLLPPRKRNWTPGKYQIGVFVRTPGGTVIQMVSDHPTMPLMRALAEVLGVPPDHIRTYEVFPEEKRK